MQIYQKHLQGSGGGRRGHLQTDVLRAATVFLHASLENFLRSLSYWKLPSANKDVIDKIPISGSEGNAKKFFLGELVAHRGKSVDKLIKESVSQYLERSNYSSINELTSFLSSISVIPQNVNSEFSSLEDLMKRRHQIVHRADIDESGGQGRHKVKSIGVAQVNNWVSSVEKFSASVLNEIGS